MAFVVAIIGGPNSEIHSGSCEYSEPYFQIGQLIFTTDLCLYTIGNSRSNLIWYVFSIKTTVEPSVIPLITLETEIQDFDDRYKRTRATIGELLRWEIVGPSELLHMAIIYLFFFFFFFFFFFATFGQ